MVTTLLLIGDDFPTREHIAALLRRDGHRVIVTNREQSLPSLCKKNAISAIGYVPLLWGKEEIAAITSWHEQFPDTPFYLFGSFSGEIPSYVTLIAPPYRLTQLEPIFPLQKKKRHPRFFPNKRVVAKSASLQQLLVLAEKVAPTRAHVFLSGESGVGKEVLAQEIHRLSHTESPFIKVNCPAIPESLAESLFFGHEKGAFTGAYESKKGYFEMADEGTLLLDEISEIPHSLQAKLLRVTQDCELTRIGGSHPIQVDVRIISTSNRDMSELVNQRILRQDLYYRLNVIPLFIPPLRHRPEDILPLAEYFIAQIAWTNGLLEKVLSQAAEERLCEYDWPGNVRELGHVIERAMILHEGSTMEASHLQFHPFSLQPTFRT